MITSLYRFAYILFLIPSISFSCQKRIKSIDVVENQPPVLRANMVRINDAIGGFYSAIPAHYNETNTRYPLLIFLHGGGQVGNGNTDLPFVLHEGVPELLNNEMFPPSFTIKGQYFSFVILAPQLSRYPAEQEVESFIEYALGHYRTDPGRIYLCGISMGGTITADVGAKYASQLAAIVPISGVSSFVDNTISAKCKNIAAGNLPVWVFQNDGDLIADVNAAKNYISLIKSFNPAIGPRYTQFLPWGLNNHDAWTRATDPRYKEDNMNMYEWMLQYTR